MSVYCRGARGHEGVTRGDIIDGGLTTIYNLTTVVRGLEGESRWEVLRGKWH